MFARASKGLPVPLLDALVMSELLDLGLLKAHPRSSCVKLITPKRKEELWRTAATASATSFSIPPSISSPFPPSLSPFFRVFF